MLAAIDRLREVSRRCLDGEPLDRDLAEWLGDSLKGYLDQRHQNIGEALGLVFPKGGVPWWREEAIRDRDAALRDLAQRCHAGHSISAQSRQISRRCDRYAASAWRFDRNREDMPPAYLRTPKELIWRAFKSGAAMPLGERQLRNILAF